MDWRDKLKQQDMTASEFLDGLTELFCDCEGLTNEEIAEDLRENGIDTDAAINRIKELLAKHGIKPKGRY